MPFHIPTEDELLASIRADVEDRFGDSLDPRLKEALAQVLFETLARAYRAMAMLVVDVPLPVTEPVAVVEAPVFKPIVKNPDTLPYWRCTACSSMTPHHRAYCDKCGQDKSTHWKKPDT